MKACKMCHSTNILFIPQYKHECVETNHEVVHDVNMCQDCGAFCYREGTYDVMEYTPNIVGRTNFVAPVSDYDVILEHKKKQEVNETLR